MLNTFFRYAKIIRIAATILTIFLSLGIVFYSLVLLFRGVELTSVPESPPGAQTFPGVTSVEYVPDRDAMIPLLAAILIMAGCSTGKLQIAWLGLATLVIFGALFLFGIGGALLLPAGLLLVLVTVIQIIVRESSKST